MTVSDASISAQKAGVVTFTHVSVEELMCRIVLIASYFLLATGVRAISHVGWVEHQDAAAGTDTALTAAHDGGSLADSFLYKPQSTVKCTVHGVDGGGQAAASDLAGLMHRLNRYRFSISAVALQMGMGYATNWRLHRFAHKLLKGVPVTVGAVGGSVTWGTGVRRGETDWFSIVTKWLKETFPHVNITSVNNAIPATPSTLILACGTKYGLNYDVDIIFLEYILNDGLKGHQQSHGPFNIERGQMYRWEQLIRKYTSLPKQPAVVHMAVTARHMACGDLRFYLTAEDQYNIVAQYYGAGSLSLRNVMFQMGRLNSTKLNGTFSNEQWFTEDCLHPNEAGHRVMADMAIMLMKQAVLHVLHRGYRRIEEEMATAPMPVPMFPGNEAPHEARCIMIEDLKGMVVESIGFRLVDEGKPGKPKIGYVATTPGARLTIKVQLAAGSTLPVNILHLGSYDHMGKTKVECSGGCTCRASVVSGRTKHMWSQAIGSSIGNITASSDVCQLMFTVLNETSSGEHKFKLLGVMVGFTWDSDMDASWVTSEYLNH